MFTKIIRSVNDNIINQINIYMSTLTETIKVDSVAISKAKFNRDNSTLTLKFKNLSEYDYFEVPLHVFNGLREADSKGRYINKYVIGEYKFRKY